MGRAAFLALYRGLVEARLHDIQLKRWVKTGKLSKAWLATGEEAVSVGAVAALHRCGGKGDVVGPMIRNASACLGMGISLEEMFGVYLGSENTPVRGRDLHMGDLSRGVIAPVSHVGSLLPVVAGAALAFKLQKEPRVALTWVGDGASKTGEVHEGLGMAAALGLPLVVILQNNQVALGTPLGVHHKGDFEALGRVHGIPCETVDGNHVLDVYAAVSLARQRASEDGGPTLLIAETFRMGGHATHDEADARKLIDPEVFAHWGARDPVGCFEVWCREQGVEERELQEIEGEVLRDVERAAEAALRDFRAPDPGALEEGVYA